MSTITTIMDVLVWRRALRFGIVGASGVLINTAALYVGHEVFGLPLALASAIAVELAIISNFLLNNSWTFGAHTIKVGRFARFNLVSLGGMAITTGVLLALVNLVGIHYLLANLVAISTAMSWNFVVNSVWTWRRAPQRS